MNLYAPALGQAGGQLGSVSSLTPIPRPLQPLDTTTFRRGSAAWDVVFGRLLRLSDLPPDWDTYGSAPPAAMTVERARAQLHHLAWADFPAPHIGAGGDGSILAGWYLGDLDIELTVDADDSFIVAVHDRRGEVTDDATDDPQLIYTRNLLQTALLRQAR